MSLKEKLPWAQTPIVLNAPLGGYANGALAAAVTNAKGLGFIGAGLDLNDLDEQLNIAATRISFRHKKDLLPVGVGLLQFISSVEEVIPILTKHKPAIVWLFAANAVSDYGEWTRRLRAELLPGTQIWIQVGTVNAAKTIAEQARPDVICAQGADAGGHGFEKGAGIISLVPEMIDALADIGCQDIPVVAAGGIADGRSAAGALAMGAQGVVLGTRFLAASETNVHPEYRRAILAASDGGESTKRSRLFDNLKGRNIWPEAYDGRSVVMESYTDYENGVSIEKIRKEHADAVKAEDGGFGVGGKGRAAMWAGTGVGLVRREQAAADIVAEVHQGVLDSLWRLRSQL